MVIRRHYPAPLIISLLLVGCIIGIVTVFLIFKPTSPTIPKETNSSQLYLPDRLPSDYSIDKPSISHPDKGVAAVVIKSKTKAPLFMSQQKLPNEFNVNQFYKNMTERKKVVNDIGNTSIGIISDRGIRQKVVSIVTKDKTWILITAEPTATNNDLISIAAHLVKR